MSRMMTDVTDFIYLFTTREAAFRLSFSRAANCHTVIRPLSLGRSAPYAMTVQRERRLGIGWAVSFQCLRFPV